MAAARRPAGRRPLRLGLLGAGRIGRRHAANIAAASGMELAAVSDPDPRALREACSIGGAAPAGERELVADASLDGIVIASPASEHVRQAAACVRARRPFLCEKPLSAGGPGARRLIASARKAGVPAMMAFNRRYDEGIARLRDRVRKGRLGKVEVIRLTSRSESPPGIGYAKTSGGLLRDKGAHFFDLACWIAGRLPERVFAAGGILFHPKLAEAGDIDTALLVIEMEGGALCQVDFSRHSAGGHDERIEVLGSKGAEELRMSPPEGAEGREGWERSFSRSYESELEAFAAALRGRRAMPVRLEAGLVAEAVAAAAHRSIRARRSVRVDVSGIGPRLYAD